MTKITTLSYGKTIKTIITNTLLTILSIVIVYIIILIILLILSGSGSKGGLIANYLIVPMYCEELVEMTVKSEHLPMLTEQSLEPGWIYKLDLTNADILRPMKGWVQL